MADSHALLLDTTSRVRKLQIAGWTRFSPSRKAQVIEALCEDTRVLGRAGLQARFPNASPREQALRLGALSIDRELMIEAFGWDPEREGR